jgi:acyl-CoA thioesterase FadM
VHEARQQFLNQFNYTELEFAGSSLIIADAAIEFKKELLYGDVVKVSVTATGFDRLGFDLHYLLEVEKNGTTSLAGKAKTGMLCFDYSTKKVVAVPEEAVKKLTN